MLKPGVLNAGTAPALVAGTTTAGTAVKTAAAVIVQRDRHGARRIRTCDRGATPSQPTEGAAPGSLSQTAQIPSWGHSLLTASGLTTGPDEPLGRAGWPPR